MTILKREAPCSPMRTSEEGGGREEGAGEPPEGGGEKPPDPPEGGGEKEPCVSKLRVSKLPDPEGNCFTSPPPEGG